MGPQNLKNLKRVQKASTGTNQLKNTQKSVFGTQQTDKICKMSLKCQALELKEQKHLIMFYNSIIVIQKNINNLKNNKKYIRGTQKI